MHILSYFNWKSKQTLVTHRKEMYDKTCGLCTFTTTTAGGLKKHMLTHTREKLHKCGLCKKSFGRYGDLKRHLLIHSGIKPYKCAPCKQSFLSADNLRRHIKTRNEKNEQFQCSFSVDRSQSLLTSDQNMMWDVRYIPITNTASLLLCLGNIWTNNFWQK